MSEKSEWMEEIERILRKINERRDEIRRLEWEINWRNESITTLFEELEDAKARYRTASDED